MLAPLYLYITLSGHVTCTLSGNGPVHYLVMVHVHYLVMVHVHYLVMSCTLSGNVLYIIW